MARMVRRGEPATVDKFLRPGPGRARNELGQPQVSPDPDGNRAARRAAARLGIKPTSRKEPTEMPTVDSSVAGQSHTGFDIPQTVATLRRHMDLPAGMLAELAAVLGMISGAVVGIGVADAERLAAIRSILDAHKQAVNQDAHGGFSTCPDGCRRCADVNLASEAWWRAALAAQGLELVDVSTLSPQEQAAHAEEQEHAMLAAEHLAAAGGPDPHYGKDIDGDE